MPKSTHAPVNAFSWRFSNQSPNNQKSKFYISDQKHAKNIKNRPQKQSSFFKSSQMIIFPNLPSKFMSFLTFVIIPKSRLFVPSIPSTSDRPNLGNAQRQTIILSLNQTALSPFYWHSYHAFFALQSIKKLFLLKYSLK